MGSGSSLNHKGRLSGLFYTPTAGVYWIHLLFYNAFYWQSKGHGFESRILYGIHFFLKKQNPSFKWGKTNKVLSDDNFFIND